MLIKSDLTWLPCNLINVTKIHKPILETPILNDAKLLKMLVTSKDFQENMKNYISKQLSSHSFNFLTSF